MTLSNALYLIAGLLLSCIPTLLVMSRNSNRVVSGLRFQIHRRTVERDEAKMMASFWSLHYRNLSEYSAEQSREALALSREIGQLKPKRNSNGTYAKREKRNG